MVAGVQLQKDAIEHEMSNQQQENPNPPKRNTNWYNFAASLFCTAQSFFRTILDHGRW